MRSSRLTQQTILAAMVICALSACSRDPVGATDMNHSPAMEMGTGDDGPAVDQDMSDAPDLGEEDLGGADMMNVEDMPEGPVDPDVTLGAGEKYVLTISPEARAITVYDAENNARIALPVDGIQLGVVPSLGSTRSFDPYGFKGDETPDDPPLDAWLVLERVDIASSDEESATLSLRFSRGVKASLKITTSEAGRYAFELVPEDATGDKIAYYRLMPQISATEGLYGLGEYFDAVNHRGHIRAMQIEIDTSLESGYNEAHVPVPLLVGTSGWGLFVQSQAPGVFDMNMPDATRVDALFGPGQLSVNGFTFHLFAEDHPLDITRHYYDLTGQVKLPARWALGPLVWRDESEDEAEVISDAETMRDLDLAVSGYWIDRPYATAVNSFDFDPTMFDDPAAMVARLNALGIRVGLWHTPYLDEKDPATASLIQEAEDNGYYPPTTHIPLNGWGKPIDVTNPAARAWWKGLLGNYTSIGIEGFKLDYGEDILPGALGRRLVWEFDDGSDERTMHAAFQLFYHSLYAEALAAPDGHFLLCRAGTWGDQVNGTIIWPGDLDANMARHGETVTKEDGTTYNAVGGLPAALIAGTGLGISGFPFYGSDTGGYRHSPPDKETFTRWFEHTALSTVMQIGTSTNDVAWEFKEENGFDEEMLGWYREYTRLHLRIWPYLWTYAENLAIDGRPIQRALGLAYPELGQHPDFTYMLGEYLLVAPVVDRGARDRDVIFPPGQWFDWWTGESLSGGTTRTVDAPLGTLPLYLEAGGVIPMLRPTIDSMAPTTEPERVDSYATDAGRLYYTIGGGANASFVVFDGASVEVAFDEVSRAYTIELEDGAEFDAGAQIELVGVMAEPSDVRLDGEVLANLTTLEELEASERGWHRAIAPARVGLHVRVPAGSHQVVVQLP